MVEENKEIIKRLENIEKIIQQQVIIELYRDGITQPNIAKNLGISAKTVNKLLKGIKK